MIFIFTKDLKTNILSPMNTSAVTIDDFELGKPLGIGRYGQVWLAKHKKTGYIVSLKMILMSNLKTLIDVKNLRREVEIHLAMEHENILKMYGYFYDSLRIYFIQEYAGKGDVWRELHERGNFSEEKSSRYILDICNALEYMHKLNVIHRDIKPENILIGCDERLKLSDFGWSVYNHDKKRTTFCGTAEYLPPEICKDDTYDFHADIWCIGILCYELCTGITPFAGKHNLKTIKQKIMSEDLEFPVYLSDECVDFIKKCCQKDPARRITIEEAKNHYFIKTHNKNSL